jgi:hypothetical protein
MTRALLISVVCLGMLVYFLLRLESSYYDAQPPIVTRIDVYADRITYRTGVYQSISALSIGLKAARDPPAVIALHDCDGFERLQAVIQAVRAEVPGDFEIALPEDC